MANKNDSEILQREPRHQPGTVRAQSFPRDEIQITVLVRSKASPEKWAAAVEKASKPHLKERQCLSHGEFEKFFGARPEDLERVKEFARKHRLKVVEDRQERARRCVILQAKPSALSEAFQIVFGHFKNDAELYRSYLGEVKVPKDLAAVVEAIFGFDNRLVSKDQCFAKVPADHCFLEVCGTPANALNFARTVYNFPNLTGEGQCIGILRPAGGYYPEDIINYFTTHNLPPPELVSWEIGGDPDGNGGKGRNDPAHPDEISEFLKDYNQAVEDVVAGRIQLRDVKETREPFTGDANLDVKVKGTIETTMDIELIGTFANKAKIVVYFYPNHSEGRYNAFSAALNDTDSKPSVIICCFGDRENLYLRQNYERLDHLFSQAAIRGITICCSSGDTVDDDAVPHFPASSPYVLACGGTMIKEGTTKEIVWREPIVPGMQLSSGGGVSNVFNGEPPWQVSAHVQKKMQLTGRGVPDVAAKADLKHGYAILVGNDTISGGGTSAATPLWGSLIALFNQKLAPRRVGFVNPLLYKKEFRTGLRDIRIGKSGYGKEFEARPGWDVCTGLGRPNGQALLDLLESELDQNPA